MDKIQEISKLKSLLDENVITQEEFSSLKTEILTDNIESKDAHTHQQNEQLDIETQKKEPTEKGLMVQVKEVGAIVNGIYLVEDDELMKDANSLGDVSGFSGWGGLVESIGIKNAEKKLVSNAKKLGANVVLITKFSQPWGGVKIEGQAYKIDN